MRIESILKERYYEKIKEAKKFNKLLSVYYPYSIKNHRGYVRKK